MSLGSDVHLVRIHVTYPCQCSSKLPLGCVIARTMLSFLRIKRRSQSLLRMPYCYNSPQHSSNIHRLLKVGLLLDSHRLLTHQAGLEATEHKMLLRELKDRQTLIKQPFQHLSLTTFSQARIRKLLAVLRTTARSLLFLASTTVPFTE